MIFSYQAKDNTGRTITGSLDAPDERRAAQDIREMGYFPMRLAPQRGGTAALERDSGAPLSATPLTYHQRSRISFGQWLLVNFVWPIWTGVGLRDMALMYRQFSAMLNAGVPIYQGLTTLTRQTSNGVLRGCLRTISERIQQGEMLTEAMAKFPWVFKEFHLAMIAAGEQTGQLDVMMSRLSSALEQEYALRNSIRRELQMPIATLLMSFLLPPVVDVIVLHDPGLYYREAVAPLLLAGAVVAALFVTGRLLSQFKVFYDGILVYVPAVGGAIRMIALARFSRAIASLYAAGVAIPEALKFAAAATGNAFLAKRMMSAIPSIMAGRGIAESLMATNVFPPMVISMVGTGEQTGGLDATMDKVAEYYEQESAVRLHQLGVTLGVVAMVIAGIRVAIVAGNFYTGYFNKMNDMANPDGP